MKVSKRQWIEACIPLAIGIVFLVWGLVTSESILTGLGIGLAVVSIQNMIRLWNLSKGDEKELDRLRGAKDERMAVIIGKAAMVAFGVAFVLLLIAACIYMFILDRFWEGLVVFGICMATDIAFLIAMWYYNKKI